MLEPRHVRTAILLCLLAIGGSCGLWVQYVITYPTAASPVQAPFPDPVLLVRRLPSTGVATHGDVYAYRALYVSPMPTDEVVRFYARHTARCQVTEDAMSPTFHVPVAYTTCSADLHPAGGYFAHIQNLTDLPRGVSVPPFDDPDYRWVAPALQGVARDMQTLILIDVTWPIDPFPL